MVGVRYQLVPLALVALTLGCATPVSVARAQFSKAYSCPDEQVTIQDARPSVRATGCGRDATYYCTTNEYRNSPSVIECSERQHITFEATDGSKYTSWADHEALLGEIRETAKRAAMASAVHDLACPTASIAVVANDDHGFANILEGCGKRITYQIGFGASPLDRRFVETGRNPIPNK
jgi:hypothetical protein